jgi:hypothetical protein
MKRYENAGGGKLAKRQQSYTLFDAGEWWYSYWRGMPEFVQKDQLAFKTISVLFVSGTDMDAFVRLVGQKLAPSGRYTRSIWFPPAEIGHFAGKAYVNRTQKTNPRYPIYVISKGRWESRLTVKTFEAMGALYRVVVEPQEYRQYAAVINPAKILKLPSAFSELGQGSIPVRNWIWDRAQKLGAKRHWCIDDNIDGFFRLNCNLKVPVADGTIFRIMEEFCDRYENVALAAPHYFMFAPRKNKLPPFYLNHRAYSCILIDNSLPYRWRGCYNEDTDLSLRVLKDGYCTVLFNAFLSFKQTTMTMKGGNTDELYKDDGRLRMAESLRDQHPDLVKVTKKWGRWQHQVDYSPFKQNRLKLRPGVVVPNGVNNYGMVLENNGKYQ